MGIESYPTPIFYTEKDNKPAFFEGDWDSVDSFIEHIEDTYNPPSVDLDPESFFSLVEASSELWVVTFTAGKVRWSGAGRAAGLCAALRCARCSPTTYRWAGLPPGTACSGADRARR